MTGDLQEVFAQVVHLGLYPAGRSISWERESAATKTICRRIAGLVITAGAAELITASEVTLPCDVTVAPATVICAGCKLSTLLEALDARRTVGGPA
ncbi:MAG TPA: hypothetical protein VF605_11715 [Allosphingosinicella sp.]|jgi:hypothetical protein